MQWERLPNLLNYTIYIVVHSLHTSEATESKGGEGKQQNQPPEAELMPMTALGAFFTGYPDGPVRVCFVALDGIAITVSPH